MIKLRDILKESAYQQFFDKEQDYFKQKPSYDDYIKIYNTFDYVSERKYNQ